MNQPNEKDPMNTLNKVDKSLIFQLKTGYVKLNSYINTIDPRQFGAIVGPSLFL